MPLQDRKNLIWESTVHCMSHVIKTGKGHMLIWSENSLGVK